MWVEVEVYDEDDKLVDSWIVDWRVREQRQRNERKVENYVFQGYLVQYERVSGPTK